MSYRTKQSKRVIKRHRRSKETRARHFLIYATRNCRCFDCGLKLRVGMEIVYRHTPLELLHRGCADHRGITYRPSIRWERAQGKRRPKPSRKRIVRYSRSELVAELVIEAGKTQKGGYSRSMLRRWCVAWPPPRGWPRDLVTRWTADVQLPDARNIPIEAELDQDLDRVLEASA